MDPAEESQAPTPQDQARTQRPQDNPEEHPEEVGDPLSDAEASEISGSERQEIVFHESLLGRPEKGPGWFFGMGGGGDGEEEEE
jgi:hypothetical protein